MSFKKTTLAFLAMGLATSLLFVSCKKDPLDGKWNLELEETTSLEFNAKEKTASLQMGEDIATGTYGFSTKTKFLVVPTLWREAGEDYSTAYAGMDYEQLATLSIEEDGSLLLQDFFEIPLYMTGGEGKKIADLNGTWTFTEGEATLTFTVDKENSTFKLREYVDIPEYCDEEGSVLSIDGNFKMEDFQQIDLVLSIDGYPVEQHGEFSMADDKKSITIDNLTFVKAE